MHAKKNILITGASGLIGTRLTAMLQGRGDAVSHLGRSKRNASIPTFTWDIGKQVIEPGALHGIDTIIHLAGAGVSDKRWSESVKREILESRTRSTALLFDALKNTDNKVTSFISASGINYYDFNKDELFTEEGARGNDFLSDVTQRWEAEADRIAIINGVRVVKLRTGIVLSEKGGALKAMAMPVKYFAGAPLGSGNQYLSWIHIDDICAMFIKAADDTTMHGAYNAVGPYAVTNRAMTYAIGKALHRPVFLPPVPGFVLKLMLGEMATIALTGSKISAAKIQAAGFTYRFPTLEGALQDLFNGHAS